jgi:hypothetical protein
MGMEGASRRREATTSSTRGDKGDDIRMTRLGRGEVRRGGPQLVQQLLVSDPATTIGEKPPINLQSRGRAASWE